MEEKENIRYTLSYSDNALEWFMGFEYLRDLRSALRKIPEYELKKFVAMKHLKDIKIVGAFTKDNRLVVFN